MTEDTRAPDDTEQPRSARNAPGSGSERSFLHRVALVDGLAVIFLLALAALWYASHALLLIFACILFAILLYEASQRVRKLVPMRRPFALALVVVLLAGIIGGGAYLMAPQISDQAHQLSTAIPETLDQLHEKAAKNPALKAILGELPSTEQLKKSVGDLLPRAGLFFSGVLGALGNTVIIIFVGIYFALQPFLYIDGIVTLVPKRKRARAREVLDEIGLTLARWMFGKFFSMVVVGIATATGLTLLDVPLALILGIIAGLLDFIPYLGPLMAGVPAVLIALSISPELALSVVLLFVGIQMMEGYLLEPLVTRKMVSLPPALTIIMQVLMGAFFGLAGVALATPLTAMLAVLVSMLYVQDLLGDNVRTPVEANESNKKDA
ncbi:AI-2E family transporter [Pseudoduganella sp. GCM10020061]|uniref:AI-2E family transporter n=1 Tax=Pseudoduganella sp. GCM10020061 TaxID=3317345 RepID=UPI00362ED93D